MKLSEYFRISDELSAEDRKARGYLTRAELGALAGVSYQSVKAFAAGARVGKTSVALALAKALDGRISLEELCEGG